MEYLVDAVLVGFNNLVNQLPNESFVSLLGFESNEGLDVLLNHIPAREVPRLTNRDYTLGDGTPLYDAITETIDLLDSEAVSRGNEDVLLIIISDGLENSSVQYSLAHTRLTIKKKQSDGWDIRFYALGPDAASESSNLGIPTVDRSSFSPSWEGVTEVFDAIEGSVAQGQKKSACARIVP